ncbi:MAG TPA: hypothetical protein VK497_04020 [Candidatus Saccharimonadales bacterium]|nr:hypothetical protein [Candidatus Saccharimonadales bacterium]
MVTLSQLALLYQCLLPCDSRRRYIGFGLKVGDGVVLSNEDTMSIEIDPQIEWAIKGGVPIPVTDKVRQGGSWV